MNDAKNTLPEKVYEKYYKRASDIWHEEKNSYLRLSILAEYITITDQDQNGNTQVQLDKVIELVNYFASNAHDLNTVKLMKMLWYADFLNFKLYQQSITGLVYRALPMGAVPVAYERIIELDGITYTVHSLAERTTNIFETQKGFSLSRIGNTERNIADRIIEQFGSKSSKQVIHEVHNERAFQMTAPNDIILYCYADDLSIS